MTRLLVDDVVKASTNAEFRSDIQLSSYRRDENLPLVRSYIFTNKAATGKKSSVELLKLLCEAYLPGNLPNRFTFIATYGHGKSHFALALANFFGKPLDSPEVSTLLDNLRHALSDQALYGFFEDFKRNHNRFLIITLRGDEPGDLQSKFFRALDDALSDYPEDQRAALPFWFNDAEAFLANIRPEIRADADAFLQEHGLDLNLLLEQVRQRESSSYALCRDLHHHLHKVFPSFGATASLREAVEWVADNLCGHNKPADGVLILFDEFSAFVRDYALEAHSRPGAPLQDLLNGVENRREKAAFVALSQHDPVTVARTTLRSGSSQTLESLERELNRLPTPQRYVLYSVLEAVLDGYLKQSGDAWHELLQEPAFASALERATDATLTVFGQRYLGELAWVDSFKAVVTEGCFPLHPMTTALLSSVQLQSTANPRSVLGFVAQELESRRNQPALKNGQPNWVLATSLVGYFCDMLGEKPWQDYRDALRQAGGPDAPDEHRAVLKAMLLQTVGDVPTSLLGYEKVIAEFCGCSPEVAAHALNSLVLSGVIRQDPVQKLYTFWPAGRGANRLEEVLSRKLQAKALDAAVLDQINKFLQRARLLPPVAVSVPWGHAEDWQATQVLMNRSTFNKQTLQRLAHNYAMLGLDGQEQSRGLVVWLVAENEEDVRWYRKNVSGILQGTFSDYPIPVVVMLPRDPDPTLARLLLRIYGLTSFENHEIADIGQDQWTEILRRDQGLVEAALTRMCQNADYEVPQALRAAVQAIRPRSVEHLLTEVYRIAYGRGPKEFFSHYKLSSNKLRASVTLVSNHLLGNALGAPRVLDTDKVAKEIVDLFLRTRWGLVDADLRIKHVAEGSRLYPGWHALDQYFAQGAGSRAAREGLLMLLNPPFGYDFHTLTLLFSAWFGYNRHDLEVSLQGRLVSIEEVARDPRTKTSRSPKDFLIALSGASILRRDRSQFAREVDEIIRRVDREVFTEHEARHAVRKLEEFVQDERNDANTRHEAEKAVEKLQSGIGLAATYNQRAAGLVEAISNTRQIAEVARLLKGIDKLPEPSCVKVGQPAPSEIRQLILGRAEELIERQCTELEHLDDITKYALNRGNLQNILIVLRGAELSHLEERATRALNVLDQNRQALEAQQKDSETLSVLEAIPTRGGLSSLRDGAQRIQGFQFYTEKAKRAARDKLDLLEGEIRRLESFVSGLHPRLDELVRSSDLRALQNEMLQHQALFEASEEETVLKAALERSQALERCFAEVDRLQQSVPSDPAEAKGLIESVRQLITEYREYLSQAQGETIEGAISVAQHDCQRRRDEALAWLADSERKLKEGRGLDRLQEELESPPLFLPGGARGRLETLRRIVQQHIDEDELLQVEAHFRRITDSRKRKECLDRLQRLAEELDRSEAAIHLG